MLPGHTAVPHLDLLFKLLAGSASIITRDMALAVFKRVPAADLETFIDVGLRAGCVWEKLGWVDWACGLWAMTALSSRALSRQLVTVARAVDNMSRVTPSTYRDVHVASDTEAAHSHLLDKLRARGKAPKGCDDWWSEGEVVALVRLLNEPHGAPDYQGVSSVLQNIDPSAVCLGVPALLDVALNAQEGCTYMKRGEVAVHALNVLAYPTLQSQKVPAPPLMIAQSISGALTSEQARRRAAAAHAVGVLHRRLAEPHWARLWELLEDHDDDVRQNSGDALRHGAGEAEVKARLNEIHRKLRDRNTRPHELCELVWVLGALSKPWPNNLLPEVIRLCTSDDDGLAEFAVAALNSFRGNDLGAAFTKRVAEVWKPDASVQTASGLLGILDADAFQPYLHEHADFVANCLGHSASEVCDWALETLWRMSVAARRPHLAAVASALMRQPEAPPSYVKMLALSGSGLAVSDLAPVIEALGSGQKRLKALTVLRGLTTYHGDLLRKIMSPVARCLTDTEDLVRVMALRVMAGASGGPLAKEDVRLVAHQLLHADDRIRREAIVVINSLSPVTLWGLGQWLVQQLLHVPQHDCAIVTCVQRLLTKVPGVCMPGHVEALFSAVESGCAATHATAINTLMALQSDMLMHVVRRMEAFISQAHVPAAVKGALIRLAVCVPAAVHTSALADAVVAGISDEEHLELREVCVNAIEFLQYSLLRERAGTVVAALLKMRPLRLVESGASLLMRRALDRHDSTIVVEHLGTVLQALHNAESGHRRDAAFALAKLFPDLCVRSHADALGRLLHHRDITVRRQSFTLVAAGYDLLCSAGVCRFRYPCLNAAPPLVDTIADALCDSDEAVRTLAQQAISSVLIHFPSQCGSLRRTVLASLLHRDCPWQPHRASIVARALFVELREKLEEGDEAARVKTLGILGGVKGDEIPGDLLKTIKRVVDEGSVSVRLAAAMILEEHPQPKTEAFDDGYMSLDFDDKHGSGTDDDEPSEYYDDGGDY